MAAPSDLTIKDLSGSWVMNKSLSDSTDATLTLQGVGWFQRKAIAIATVYLAIKHYTDEEGVSHVDIDQTATGGIKGTSESRTLNWIPRSHDDHIFGSISGRSRWSTGDVEDSFLKEGWLDRAEEKGGPAGEQFVETFAVNEERGWNTRQVWGFAVVDGERYYVRRVVTTKGDEVIKIRLVYNFVKKND